MFDWFLGLFFVFSFFAQAMMKLCFDLFYDYISIAKRRLLRNDEKRHRSQSSWKVTGFLKSKAKLMKNISWNVIHSTKDTFVSINPRAKSKSKDYVTATSTSENNNLHSPSKSTPIQIIKTSIKSYPFSLNFSYWLRKLFVDRTPRNGQTKSF